MKRIVFVSVLCLLGLNLGTAAAKDPKKTKAPEAPAKNAASAKIPTDAPKTVDELIKHFEGIDASVRSISAHFTQSLTMSDAGLSQRVEGSIEFLKPGHLHMEQTLPERQTVVSDGKSIWIHRLAQNQVIESALADWKKADPTINSLMDFGDYAKIFSVYNVAYDSAQMLAVLTPKKKSDQPFVLKLKLSGPYSFPAETELVVGKTKILGKLSDIHFNPEIPEGRFHFSAPPGAQVFEHFKPPIQGKTSP